MRRFRAWCRTYVGCEGGDFGGPARRSIWVSGIEPGGPYAVDAEALGHMAAGSVPLAAGYADWRDNLSGSFRRRILKLLVAIAGGFVADYRAFAADRRPFTRGSRGYARLNLYPVGFADTDPHRWTRGLAQLTGFATKADYVAWCDAERLPVLRTWTRAYRPRLIVGLGKSYRAQFCRAFAGDASLTEETLCGRSLLYGTGAGGALLAVVPFPTSASGLQSNAAIQAFGDRLRELLAAAPQSAAARAPAGRPSRQRRSKT